MKLIKQALAAIILFIAIAGVADLLMSLVDGTGQ